MIRKDNNMYKVLNKVNSPEDVKRLNIEELNEAI